MSIKYVTFIMRADNEGEGGIMALVSLIQRAVMRNSKRNKKALIALGIFGASLFYGDGMITPAVSVLSAVEGLKIVSPSLDDYVLPIALAVLTMLFLIQRFGTGAVGTLFGPVMALWFGVLAVLGAHQVIDHPSILRALSPHYAVMFFYDDTGTAFLALASVVLAVTGAEALYADMGHFGRSPIRRAWFLAAFPALMLNYLGQGSLLIHDPTAVDNPFYRLVPESLQVPMVILATVATVIASQAVISGAFSVTRQAVQLGFLPRLTIRHTSEHSAGQVYVPAVNWILFAAIVGLVVGFRTSSHLASAYGIAVTGTLAIDTLLFFVVVHTVWKRSLGVAIAGAAAFLVVDLAFFAANLTKIVHGGWFPIVIAITVFTILMTWQRGRAIVTRNRMLAEGSLTAFINELETRDPPIARVPGCAVFLNASADTTPLALRHNVMHNHVLHERVVIVTVEAKRVPHVARRRPHPDRRSRRPARRDPAGARALRVPGRDRRAGGAAPRGRGGGRGRGDRRRRRLVLPLAHHDHPDGRAGPRRLAQAALRGHEPERGEPGRVLRAARGSRGRARQPGRPVSKTAVMDIGRLGVWANHNALGDEAGTAASLAEDLGYGTFWLGGSPRLPQLRPLLEATDRIVVATSIVNVWAYEPAELAAEYAELEREFPGRVLVGIGVGHPEATSDYARPLSALRAFLDGLDAAPSPLPADRRVLAALAPRTLDLSAERSLGTIPYFVPVAHTAAARAQLGPDALVAPELAFALDEDAERARTTAESFARGYLARSNYTNTLLRHGYASRTSRAAARSGCSTRSCPTAPSRPRQPSHARTSTAGADHVALQALGEGPVPRRGWTALAAALA